MADLTPDARFRQPAEVPGSHGPLEQPTPSAPIMFGARVATRDLLPWSWAEQRLIDARNYWIATTRQDGVPHTRPVWGVWQPAGFYFSTGSLARHNLAANPAITVHLESGDESVIVEGTATPVAGDQLAPALDDYNAKYSWTARATDTGMTDDAGAEGPAFLVRPHAVFGWVAGFTRHTKWTFPPGA